MRGRVPSRQATGLYVHSSPPTGVPVHDSVVRQWLRGGEIARLRELVLEGDGPSLVGEYSPDVTARVFLRALPRILSRIDEAHKAASEGDIDRLEKALKKERSVRVELSKDHSGLSLLHKAVIHGHHNLQDWLVKNYPETVHLTDRERRTALHYAGSSPDSEEVWKRLTEAGADPTATDSGGNTPAYYMHHPRKARPPQPRGSQLRQDKAGLIVKPANIRIWIHDRDLGRLQKVVWEGYGHKLLSETSTQPKVRRFLNAVPYILGSIRDIHKAAIENDVETLTKKTEDPVPSSILLSKDANGLNPLHKAAGLGQKDAVHEILSRAPEAANAQDNLGRTPLHYAAGLRDPELYQILVEAGATDHLQDKKGNTPSYYRSKPGELEGGKLLYLVPEAPRTAHIFPPSWDWRLLQTSAPGARLQDSSEAITQETTVDEMIQEDVSKDEGADESRPEVSEDEGVGSENAQSVDETASPQNSENIDMEQEEDPEDRLGQTVTLSTSEMFGEDSGMADGETDTSPKIDTLLESENTPLTETSETGNNNEQEENSHKEEGNTNIDNTELDTGLRTEDNTSDAKDVEGTESKEDVDEEKIESESIVNQESAAVENNEQNHDESNVNEGSLNVNKESINEETIQKEEENPLQTAEESNNDTEINNNPTVEDEISTETEIEENKELSDEIANKSGDTEIAEASDNATKDENDTADKVDVTQDEPLSNESKVDPIEESNDAKDNSNIENTIDETNNSLEESNEEAGTPVPTEAKIKNNVTEDSEQNESSENVNEIENHQGSSNAKIESESIEPNTNEIDRETGEASNLVECTNDPQDEANDEQPGSNMEEEIGEMSKENETGETTSECHKTQSGRRSLKSRVQSVQKAIRLGRGQTEEEDEDDLQAQGISEEDKATENDVETKENSNTDDEGEVKKESQEEFPDSLEGTPQKIHKTGENQNGESIAGSQKENGDTQIIEIHKSRQSSAETRTLSAVGKGDRRTEAEKLVASADMEGMAEMVLSGEGEQLLSLKSDNPDVQLFINNVPQYMAKIEKVHKASREGDLRGVQTSLDRRKFAVARDNATSLKPTPLHVAVLFGRTSVLRYLAGRFPETMHAQDSAGRTPLHYASTLPDNGHFYSLLITLGADKAIPDNAGKTAEYYLRNNGELTREMLLAEYQDRPVPIDTSGLNFNRYSDKVKEDTVTARHDVDEEILLEQMERCYKLIAHRAPGSHLGQILNRELFEELHLLYTKHDNTLLDLLRPAGMDLGLGKNRLLTDPNFSGISIPDIESFRVFPSLIEPLITQISGVPIFNNLETDFFGNEQDNFFNIDLDPGGAIVKSCIVEIARNISIVPFAKNLKLSDLEKVEVAMSTVLMAYYRKNKEATFIDEAGENHGSYYSLGEILENKEVFKDLKEEGLLIDGVEDGTWPYGRGVFISPYGDITAWVNIREHLQLLSVTPAEKRGRIGEAYKTACEIIQSIEEKVECSRDQRLGLLATDPALVGNCLRIHIVVSLPHVGEDLVTLRKLCSSRQLVLEGNPSPGVFRIRNRSCQGITEIKVFKSFVKTLSEIIEMERASMKVTVAQIPGLIKNFLRKKSSKDKLLEMIK